MRRLVLLLTIWAGSAAAGSLNYAPGETFTVVLNGGTRCKVRVTKQVRGGAVVEGRGARVGCPQGPSLLRWEDRRDARRKKRPWQYVTRPVLGIAAGAAMAGLVFVPPLVADQNPLMTSFVYGTMTTYTIAGSGGRWFVYVNRSTLEEVQ